MSTAQKAAVRPVASSGEKQGAAPAGFTTWGAGVFFTLFLLVSLFYVWSHMQVVKATYELGTLQKQLDDQIERNDKLHLEIRMLRSPTHLAGVASRELGMAPATQGQVIVVKQPSPPANVQTASAR